MRRAPLCFYSKRDSNIFGEEFMRKASIAVGQLLAVLVWLSVLAAVGTSRISLLAPMESVASAATGTDKESTGAPDHRRSRAVRRFERSLAEVQPLLARYGYGAAFAAVMAEGMGIPTPGQTLLMAS